MTATEILEAITAAGGELCRIGDELSIRTTEPLAPELVGYLREFKDDLLPLLLGSQDARGGPPNGNEAHPIAAGDGRARPAYIAQCPRCHGTRWGPTGRSLTETLRDGEQLQTEVWHCLNCAIRPEGTRPPTVPETIPPGSVESPCLDCDKRYRLFVRGSPDIKGEPAQDVLICGRCGFTETPEASLKRDTQNATACWECGPYTVIRDMRGLICYKCHTRL